jgi:hypothetical protein
MVQGVVCRYGMVQGVVCRYGMVQGVVCRYGMVQGVVHADITHYNCNIKLNVLLTVHHCISVY